ncbi:cytochrome P450 [Kibdelosporangium banguiense]|uniref:Cytochrome P450 n=1 Tax=Kibdelosporangium banguiense TaxID=1365924 RepID=A0ABS4U2P8_9PSEU|nr:cytochrome P450 [Kibdelosporangium banguiense]MBP2330488.1 cytochrome P450 [Kibdelosporangium banguiense]
MTETLEFPTARAAGCPFSPPPQQREAQAEAPISKARIWDGSTHWFITGHAEQRAVLSDTRFSADERLPGFPHQNLNMAENVAHRPLTVFNSDAPEHTRFRRLMTFPFTFKRVEALRPAIQRITDDLIDAMLLGPNPTDLVTALALPLPTLMISEMLGVPYEDHEFFQRNAVVAVDRHATTEEGERAGRELGEYLAKLIAERMYSPGEGWVFDIAERVTAGELTVAEAAQMGVVLLIAGHETSANMIALGTFALLQNPEQLAVFRDSDDPRVIADGVEEMLRYLSIAQHGLRRIATEDVEIAGQTIRAGEGIIVPLPVANWDPSVFPSPERLDLHREARQHHAFGFGIHQCVGQQLARAELQIVYGTLYRRIPTLALATDIDQIEFKSDHFAFGVTSLPVTW